MKLGMIRPLTPMPPVFHRDCESSAASEKRVARMSGVFQLLLGDRRTLGHVQFAVKGTVRHFCDRIAKMRVSRRVVLFAFGVLFAVAPGEEMFYRAHV